MKARVLPWIGLPLMIGVISFFTTRYYFSHAGNESVPFPTRRIEAPATIDLGVCPIGRKELRFPISNCGNRPVEIKQALTSCSCISIGSSSQPTTRLANAVILPGERLEIVVTLSLRPQLEEKFSTTITLITDDNEFSEIIIPITATLDGYLDSSPAQIVLGSLNPNQIIDRAVSIRDRSRHSPRRLGHIESSNPQVVKLRSVKIHEGKKAQMSEPTQEIAILDLLISAPESPQTITEEIRVYEEGMTEPSLRIPVNGAVHPPILVSPSHIYLPLSTGSGATYSVTCLLRHPENKPFNIQLELPPEIQLQGDLKAGPKRVWSLTMAWRREKIPAAGDSITSSVVVKAIVEEKAVTFKLPVTCKGMEDSP